MKKYLCLLLLIPLLFINGCSKEDSKSKEYNNAVKKLSNVETFDTNYPFDIILATEDVGNETRYTITLNNPKEDLYDVSMLVIHNVKTDNIFPSVGIVDDKVNLMTSSGKKGIILVGYIPINSNPTYKLMVNYNNKTNYIKIN